MSRDSQMMLQEEALHTGRLATDMTSAIDRHDVFMLRLYLQGIRRQALLVAALIDLELAQLQRDRAERLDL